MNTCKWTSIIYLLHRTSHVLIITSPNPVSPFKSKLAKFYFREEQTIIIVIACTFSLDFPKATVIVNMLIKKKRIATHHCKLSHYIMSTRQPKLPLWKWAKHELKNQKNQTTFTEYFYWWIFCLSQSSIENMKPESFASMPAF